MSEQTKPSPVDRLFSRLQLAYGRKWLSMWDGIEDEGAVKEEWSRRLAPFANAEGAAAIAWVLDHALPTDWPPTSLEFVALVKGALPAKSSVPRLEATRTPAPERARAVQAQLAQSLRAGQAVRQTTAERLRELAESGQKLNLFQREMLREALARQQLVPALADQGSESGASPHGGQA
jgi:hypothetical protein